MVITGFDIVEGALRWLAVVDVEEQPSPRQQRIGLDRLNRMTAQWSTRRLMVPVVVSEQLALGIGQASRTIGPAGQWATVRPLAIAAAFLRDAAGTDWPLDPPRAFSEYQQLSLKTLAGRPERIYYNPTFPEGTVYFHRVPTEAYTVFLDSQKPLGAMTLGTKVNLPDEYVEALESNLGVRLAPVFAVKPSEVMVAIARESVRNLKSLHAQPVEPVGFDVALVGYGRRFDIRRGW